MTLRCALENARHTELYATVSSVGETLFIIALAAVVRGLMSVKLPMATWSGHSAASRRRVVQASVKHKPENATFDLFALSVRAVATFTVMLT